MNEQTRNEQTTDPLSRWWWPGQWLRIVYAVRVDQVQLRKIIVSHPLGEANG
jgi:hypothetical protein